MIPRYHINVFWSDADGEWTADIPDLQTCCAGGATPAQAIAEVLIAMDGWIATARDMNLPVPEPKYRPGSADTERKAA